jgi:hypothetical protein
MPNMSALEKSQSSPEALVNLVSIWVDYRLKA